MDCLRRMIQEHGMVPAADLGLESVRGDMRVLVEDIAAVLLTNPACVSCRLLQLQDIAHEVKIEMGELDGGTGTSLQAVANLTATLARSLSHKQVCSVHVLHGLLQEYPNACDRVLEVARAVYREHNPLGTRWQGRILELALDKGDEAMEGRVRRLIADTPLALGSVSKELHRYLTSEQYPFGPEQYAKYRLCFPDPDTLLCFLATLLPPEGDIWPSS